MDKSALKNKSDSIADELISCGKELSQLGYLAAADGNISYRLDASHILITPSGRAKRRLNANDLILISPDGHILEGAGSPSSETLMHLVVFNHAPQSKVVIHCHPPHCIAFSLAFPELSHLPGEYFSELILALGSVPIVPYARPGTKAMGDVLIPHLPNQKAFILARHGALAWGEDIEEAMNGIERMEHAAHTLMIAQQWLAAKHSQAVLNPLPKHELDHLFQKRAEGIQKSF